MGWTFVNGGSGGSGVAGNGSAFTYANPDAPTGTQVAFVQDTSALVQSLTLPVAGTVQVAFPAAQRNYGGVASTQAIAVALGDVALGTLTPAGTSYAPLTTAASPPLAAGTYDLTLTGTNLLGGDNTA